MRDTCDPVGSDDIANRLGFKRDTVKMWRHRGVFPAPRWTVSGRPCWNWRDVEKWARDTGRFGTSKEAYRRAARAVDQVADAMKDPL